MEDFISEVMIEESLADIFDQEIESEPAKGFGDEIQPKRPKKKKKEEEQVEFAVEELPPVKRHHDEPRPLTPRKQVPQRGVKAAVRSTSR